MSEFQTSSVLEQVPLVWTVVFPKSDDRPISKMLKLLKRTRSIHKGIRMTTHSDCGGSKLSKFRIPVCSDFDVIQNLAIHCMYMNLLREAINKFLYNPN